jgi:hypothetical protein
MEAPMNCGLSDETLRGIELKQPDWLTSAHIADMAEELLHLRRERTAFGVIRWSPEQVQRTAEGLRVSVDEVQAILKHGYLEWMCSPSPAPMKKLHEFDGLVLGEV